MADFCPDRIRKYFGERVDPDKVEAILKEINNMHAAGLDRTVLRERMRELVNTVQADQVEKYLNKLETLKSFRSNLDMVEHPSFKGNKQQGIDAILFINRHNVPGAGNNVESNFHNNLYKYVGGLDMAIKRLSPKSLATAMSGDFDIELLKTMRGEMQSDNPFVTYMAQIGKHYNDMLYTDYNNAGVYVPYRENYGFKRVYDGQKIRDAGFPAWMSSLAKNLDIEKSFKNVSSEELSTLNEAMRQGLDHEAFKRLGKKSTLVAEFVEDFEAFQKEYDPFSMEIYSKLLEAPADKKFRARSYVFKNSESELSYMKEFGAFDSIYGYWKGAGRLAARELSLVDKFGPTPKVGFEDLIAQMAISDKNFSKETALTKYAYATGKVIRDDSFIEKGMRWSSAAVLGTSGISQIGDLSATQFNYLWKDTSNVVSSFTNGLYQYISSIPSVAVSKSLPYIVDSADALERAWGEQMVREFGKNPSGFVLDAVYTLSGSKFMNKVAANANLNLYTGLLRKASKSPSLSRFHTEFLKRWDLVPEDLMLVEPILKNIDSPLDIAALPDNLFDQNRMGIPAKKYKQVLAQRVYNFLNENIRQGAPTPGWSQAMLANGNSADQNEVISRASRMFFQFKRIGIKQLQDFRQLSDARSPDSNMAYKALSGTSMIGSSVALTLGTGLTISYLKSLMNNGGDKDKTDREFFDPKELRDNIIQSSLRNGSFSLMTEPLMNADSVQDALVSSVTPSVKQAYRAGVIPASIARRLLTNKDPLDREQAREIVDSAKMAIPGYNLLYFMPYMEEKKKFEKQMIREVDKLWEK